MTKADLIETLKIYLENGIDEIISEEKQNRFLKQNEQVANYIKPPLSSDHKSLTKEKFISETELNSQKITQLKPDLDKNLTSQNFIKPIFSTSQALSTLAKKNQQTDTQNLSDISQESKFLSLKEIVTQAKNAAQNSKNLIELRKAVENFDGCNLKKMATNTVFCDGNANAKVMVLGEAPGNHEDLQGIPFCGDSGVMLNEMLGAIGLTRAQNFYISNVIFWRPPGNRRPSDEELAICRPFVERHIQLINPEILVLVGATAMSAVLGINEPIGTVRGKLIDFSPPFLSRKIKSFTIFHPSYLMRQPSKKKIAWFDMLKLESFLKNNFHE